MILPKTDLEKTKTATPDEKKNMAYRYTTRAMGKKITLFPAILGLSSPAIQKTFQTKSEMPLT